MKEEGIVSKDTINKFMSLDITREILKLPIMTISYNVGLSKMGNELLKKMGSIVRVNNLIETKFKN